MSRQLNLLPPARRRRLAQQWLLGGINRIVGHLMIGLSMLTVSGVVAVIVLQAFVFSLSRSEVAGLPEAVADYQQRRDDIARTNLHLRRMYELSREQVVWSALLVDLFPLFPPGITIEKITGRAAVATVLTFNGRSQTRQSLVVLGERLKKLPWVSNIQAPPTNLLQRVDAVYVFDLTVIRPGQGRVKP